MSAAGGASAQQCASPLSSFQSHGSAISLVSDGSVDDGLIAQALTLWQACANYGDSFPVFRHGGSGSRTVRVGRQLYKGVGLTCGTFNGSTIQLFDLYVDRAGELHPCGSLAQNLAHELGHALGLEDAPDEPLCAGSIMSPLTHSNQASRRVSVAECVLVGQKWITGDEELRVATLGNVAPYEFVVAGTRSAGARAELSPR
jgi:hypothetical protein